MKMCKFDCRAICSVVGLIFGYFLYLLFGGFMFVLIERDVDRELKNTRREDFLKVLARHNISVNSSVIQEVVTAAVAARDVNGLSLQDYTLSLASEWTLGSSVFFSGTIVTTIGYGNISPRTTWGRVFCIIFATIGIPFTGVVLGRMGLGLTNLIKTADTFIENRIKNCFPKASKKENMKSHVRSIQLAFVVTMFVLIFLLLPAAAMTKTELKWSFFDAFYFCFISLSTIGLGDITPGASEIGINFSHGFQWNVIKNSLHQVSIILYLLTGLAALSIILALIGSMMKSAAEKTLKGGTDLMSGGQQLVGGARRFASSMRQKAATAMNIGRASPNHSDSEDAESEMQSPEKAPIAARIKKVRAFDNDGRQIELKAFENQTELDGNPLEIVIENDDASSSSPDHEVATSHTVLSSGKVSSLDGAWSSGNIICEHDPSSGNGVDPNNDSQGIFYVVPKKNAQNLPTAEG